MRCLKLETAKQDGEEAWAYEAEGGNLADTFIQGKFSACVAVSPGHRAPTHSDR